MWWCQLYYLKNWVNWEHLERLTRRLSLEWRENWWTTIWRSHIADRLKAPENVKDISKISQKFKVLMSKRNVNGALKRLTNSMSNGMFPLYKKTLDLQIQKHPEPKESSPETFYRVHFDQFTESHMMASTNLWSCAQQC